MSDREWMTAEAAIWWDDSDQDVEVETPDGAIVTGKMMIDAYYDRELEEEVPIYCGLKLADGTVATPVIKHWRRVR